MKPSDLGPILHTDHSLTLTERGQNSLGATGSVFTRHRHTGWMSWEGGGRDCHSGVPSTLIQLRRGRCETIGTGPLVEAKVARLPRSRRAHPATTIPPFAHRASPPDGIFFPHQLSPLPQARPVSRALESPEVDPESTLVDSQRENRAPDLRRMSTTARRACCAGAKRGVSRRRAASRGGSARRRKT